MSSRDRDEEKALTRSLFSKRDDDGTLEENLLSYIKVFEEDGGHGKTRYLMLAINKHGRPLLHKGKKNSNGTFSKGKTWQLDDMRVLEQIGPIEFALTMTVRTYRWRTERPDALQQFLGSLVTSFKDYTGHSPELVNFTAPAPQSFQGASSAHGHSPVPEGPPPAPSSRLRGAPGMGSQSSLASSAAAVGRRPSAQTLDDRSRRPDDHGRRPSAQTLDDHGRRPSAQTLDDRGRRPSAQTMDDARSMDSHSHHHHQASGVGIGEVFDQSAFKQGSGTPTAYDAMGLNRPPAQRQNSNDTPTSSVVGYSGNGINPGAMAALGASSGRRPSAGSATSPLSPPREDIDDPYGGMEEESLATPQNGSFPHDDQPIIPPAPSSAPVVPALPTVTESPSQHERSPSTPAMAKSPSGSSQATSSVPDALAPPTLRERRTPSPAMYDDEQEPPEQMNRRVSFHPAPPSFTTAYSRDVLLTSRSGLSGADVVIEGEDDESGDAIMANVEEMIEGFDWTASTSATAGESGRKGPDAIEQRLLDELAALESANIHAFLESDDRVEQVLQHIDDTLAELEDIDLHLTGYRMQLNAVQDDIDYIEGQNRGLQVQISNQHALLKEVQQLLAITDVPKEDLQMLSQASPSTQRGVQELEQAATALYKALQAARDNEATGAHIQEYEKIAVQFATRVLEYLDITFKHKSSETLAKYKKTSQLKLEPHNELCENLMLYEGLVLWVKDMDDERYKKLCLNYITAMSKLHEDEMKKLLVMLVQNLSKSIEGVVDVSFAKASQGAQQPAGIGGALREGVARSKTLRQKAPGADHAALRDRKADGSTRKVAELYSRGMGEIVSQIVTEDSFINAFLHLADNETTFADYMDLDTYFRRQAGRHSAAKLGKNPALAQIARTVMDLMFGFVDGEWKNWIEAAIGLSGGTLGSQKNTVAIVGVIGETETLLQGAEQEGGNLFLVQLFEKQLGRQRQIFDSFIKEQIRTIDGAKNTIKKRRGVFYFVRHFPVFVERIESQLGTAEGLDIRKRVNDAYEQVVASVLGSLQYVSKLVGSEISSGEGKDQLYFHVVMIENLNVFVDETQKLKIPALAVFVQRARGLYEENMRAYVKMMLRRGFARLMDFFDGVERLSRTTPANEISVHSNYNRSALKKVIKEQTAKDMRKAVEAMARRVDKHFSDDDSTPGVPGANHHHNHQNDKATQDLINHVWREITSTLVGEINRANEYLSKSYNDSGLSFEFNGRDVEQVCQRAKRM